MANRLSSYKLDPKSKIPFPLLQVNFTAKNCRSRDSPTGQVAVVQPLTLNRIAQKIHSPPGTGSNGGGGPGSNSGVMTTFVPKANCNMMMMTSSTIVTSFDETDDLTETEVDIDSCCNTGSDVTTTAATTTAPPVGQLASKTAATLSNFSRMSSEETSSLFYNMKTSL